MAQLVEDAYLDTVRAALAPRFRIEREIGRGGTATVFLAYDSRYDRQVAIKVLRPELAAAVWRERFFLEVKLTARLSHPHILKLLESDEVDGVLYYVMPYVAGESLRARIRREQYLPIEEAIRITQEVSEALTTAHGQGVVHRDIKPENILFEAGHALVADFGIAKAITEAAGERLTTTGLRIGTVGYMSPEQATGQSNLDQRSDVYSLACVLYEMLAGETPYNGPSAQAIIAKQLSLPVPSLRVVRETVPPELEETISRALAKVPADRYSSVAEFASEVSGAGKPRAWVPWLLPMVRLISWVLPGVRLGTLSRRPLLLAGLAATFVVAALAIAMSITRVPVRGVAIDANLVAVAPFEVLDPALAVWREGLVDLLSRTLDGAGPLRTVPPTSVIRRWVGRADAESAERLGRSTGAGLIVFGVVAPSGEDSVWVTAQALDVQTGRLVADVEVRDALSRMDRLQTELTLPILRQIGAVRPLGAAPVYSLGSSSLPAVKAFLQGEQHFRRTAFDSATVYYQRALGADSAFALPLHRLFAASMWQQAGVDQTTFRSYALRAGVLNRGLPPRESLLITADSLSAASTALFTDTAYWSRTRRLLKTLDEAARRYPEDPEVWYRLATTRYTFGHAFGITSPQVLEAVDHSISLDSAFAPAYLSGFLSSSRMGDEQRGLRYARAYLKRRPGGDQADAIRLMFALADAEGEDPGARQRLIEQASDDVLFATYNKVAWWSDPGETAVQIARELMRRSARMSAPASVFARFDLAFALAWRGHVEEAFAVAGSQPTNLFGGLALLGGVPGDTAAAVFQRLLHGSMWPPTRLPLAVSWWAMRGDTASLRTVIQRGDSTHRASSHSTEAAYATRLSAAASAYLDLVRGDTARALDGLLALADSACPNCFVERLTLAELLIRAGRLEEASSLLRKDLADPSVQNNPLFVPWTLLRARLAERSSERSAAVRHYSFVAAVWRGADPELAGVVEEARAGLRRLGARPK